MRFLVLPLLAVLAFAPASARAQETVDPAVIYGVGATLTGFGAALTLGGFYGEGSPSALGFSLALYAASQLVISVAGATDALGQDPLGVGVGLGVVTAINVAGIVAGIVGLILQAVRPRPPPDPEEPDLQAGPGGIFGRF